MSRKKSGLGCLPLMGIAIALLVGGRYLSRQVIGKELTPSDAAEVISDKAMFAAFVETDLEQWSKITELGNSKSQQLIAGQIEKFKTEIDLESADFSYQKDIQPWLDGAMFASIPGDGGISDPEMLVVLGVKNKLKAYKFLKKIEAETELVESKYKGVKITEAKGGKEDTISALIGNRLLLAEERDIIEQAIDTYKDKEDKSLADNQQILKQKIDTGDSLTKVYIPNYGKLIADAIAQDPQIPAASAELLSVLNSVDSIVMGFGVEKQGLRFQSVTQFNSDELTAHFKANPSKILKRLPDNAIAVVNGNGINVFWEQFVAQIKQHRDTSRYFNLAKLGTRQTANLDLETDIFNWMDGEFAIALTDSPKSSNPQFNLGLSGGIILETSQPNKAKETIGKLENSLQKNLAVVPQQKKINQQTTTQWRVNGTSGGINYGWLDKNHLLFAWDDSTFESFSESGKKPLAKNKSFQAMTKQLPKKNAGYLYIDVAQIMQATENFPLAKSASEAEIAMALLNSIEAVGSTVTMPDSSTSQQDLFIMFKDN